MYEARELVIKRSQMGVFVVTQTETVINAQHNITQSNTIKVQSKNTYSCCSN